MIIFQSPLFDIYIYTRKHAHTHTHTHTHTFVHKKSITCPAVQPDSFLHFFFRLAFTKIPVNGDPVAFLGPSLSPPPPDGQSCSSTVI